MFCKFYARTPNWAALFATKFRTTKSCGPAMHNNVAEGNHYVLEKSRPYLLLHGSQICEIPQNSNL